MILDSSAILAVFQQEPGFEALQSKMEAAETLRIGAPTLSEAGIVLTIRSRRNATPILSRFLQEYEVDVVAFSAPHWRQAVEAYDRFGKGRHSAALNFGDCMTYAVAKLARRPLICKGDDFGRTDLEIA